MTDAGYALRFLFHAVISDGVVPYWSSHLDGAESEKIVPSGRPAHRDPQAIAEMVRILKKHIAGEGSVEGDLELPGVETRCDSPPGNSSRSSTMLSN